MAEPPFEFYPSCASLLPFLLSHEVAFLGILKKLILQLMGGLWVDDDGIDLIVISQTAGIQVRTAYGAVFPIHHHNLRVMETWAIAPNIDPTFRQPVCIIEHNLWHQGLVVSRRDENIHLHTSVSTAFQGFHDGLRRGKVWVDNLHRVLGTVEGMDIETAHDLVGGMWLTIGNAFADGYSRITLHGL